MKNYIFTLMLIVAGVITYAQQPDFMFLYPFEEAEGYAGAYVLEVGSIDQPYSHFYLLPVCNLTADHPIYADMAVSPAKVLKVSDEGELVGELVLGEEGRRSVIYKLYPSPDDPTTFLAVGKIRDIDGLYDVPMLAKFDIDMNILWLNEIPLDEVYQKYFNYARVLMDSHGDIVFCTAPIPDDWQTNSNTNTHLLYLRLSSTGEVLAMLEFPQNTNWIDRAQSDLFEYNDGSGNYGHIIMTGNAAKMLRLSRDFDIVSQFDMPTYVGVPLGATIPSVSFSFHDFTEAVTFHRNDGTFIVGTTVWESILKPNGMTDHTDSGTLVIMKVDEVGDVIPVSYSGHDNDSLDLLAFNKGMDWFGDNRLYFCNYQMFSNNLNPDRPNCLVVTATDSAANIEWQRYYEDDGHVIKPASIVASKDGGCLVSGYRYKCDDYMDCEVFLVKFFADGTLSIPESEGRLRPYTFCPNPVQGMLKFCFSPDVEPASIEIFDMQGRIVHRQGDSFENVNMSQLPPGLYTLCITFKSGMTFSDRVVKE